MHAFEYQFPSSINLFTVKLALLKDWIATNCSEYVSKDQ